MPQSEKVRKVLRSDEFYAWAPYERKLVELKASSNLTLGFLFAAGISGTYMLAFQARTSDFSGWLPTLLSLLGGLFTLYVLFFGLGGSRQIIYDDVSFEISANNLSPLRSDWSEIVSVKRIWFNGFEVKTRRGSAKVRWWILPLWDDGYSKFLFHVFKTLAVGYENGKLKQYRPPVTLEIGEIYVYEIPPNVVGVFHIVTACASLILAILDTIYGGSKTSSAISILGLMYSVNSFYQFWKGYAPQPYFSGDKVTVMDEEISVTGKSGTKRVPLALASYPLLPTFKPRPFKDTEIFGEGADIVAVDRRFLVKADT